MAKTLYDFLSEFNNIIVLTGAGVSTDSGIPDFRSESGTYSRWDSAKVFDIEYFRSDPEYFFNYAREELYNFENIKPNSTHYFLAALEKRGKIKAIITQNIDMLHQRAGSKKVFELHGSIKDSHCLSCGKYYHYQMMRTKVFKEKIPHCKCSGIIKPDIVFFGESLPEKEINGAYDATLKADLFITMGTSLLVYPAASLPQIAKENGTKLIIINREATPLDNFADLTIHDELNPLIKQLENHF
jgi:NAD-dependent deacetylase